MTWAKVTPLVRGRIVEMCACEGDEVARGYELARLYDPEARAMDILGELGMAKHAHQRPDPLSSGKYRPSTAGCSGRRRVAPGPSPAG